VQWVDALGDAAGPLRTAAQTFAEDLPAGPEGLRFLVERIESYCEREEPSADEDRAFVEGAGAALGLLLIAHVGEGAHAQRDGNHRVRLGPFGFFDPFGAIEEILDADDPRAALADAVRGAEAEARGDGPLSRIVTRLSSELASRTPPLIVREHFERYVRLSDETEIDLARVVDATRDGDEADVSRSVDKLLSFLGGQKEAMSWPEARTRLLPRLLPPGFIGALPASDGQHGELAIRSFRPTLDIAVLVGHEGRSRFVRVDELEGWGTSFEDALAIAVENLAARSAAARFARIETDAGPLVVARSGDGLDAARLVLPGLHDVLAPELGSPFLASVPHRDTLLAASREPRSLVEALKQKTSDDAARAPHRIADALYLVTADGLSDVPGS